MYDAELIRGLLRSTFVLALAAPALVGCGGSDTETGSTTTTSTSTSAATAKVTVYDDGEPLAGADVFFHDAAGALLTTTKTGADGTATGEVRGEAIVTVAVTATRDIASVYGVKAGDALVFGSKAPLHRKVGTARVSTVQEVVGAKDFVLDFGGTTKVVSSLDPPVDVDVIAAVKPGDGPFEVLAFARDKDEVPVQMVSGEAPSFDAAGVAEIALSGWSGQADSLFLRLKNPPSDASFVQGRVAPVGKNGLAYYAINGWQAVMPTPLSILVFGLPQGFGQRLEYIGGASWGDQGSDAESTITRRTALGGMEVDVELDTTLLPRVSGVTAKIAPNAAPSVSWTADDAFAGADAVLVQSQWSTAEGDVGWTALIAPGQAASLTLPALPAGFASWLPASASAKTLVTVVDADYIASWGELISEHGPGLLGLPFPDGELSLRLSTAVAK